MQTTASSIWCQKVDLVYSLHRFRRDCHKMVVAMMGNEQTSLVYRISGADAEALGRILGQPDTDDRLAVIWAERAARSGNNLQKFHGAPISSLKQYGGAINSIPPEL
jgi:hypothetical protein